MSVSSLYWSPFHASDWVCSRNEQQKVYFNLLTLIESRITRARLKVSLNFASKCFSEKWKKLNTGPVCFGARDDSYVAFNIKESGVIYTFKLLHRSGSVICNPDHPPSYWGCVTPFYGDTRLLTILTFKNRSRLLLADYKNRCGYPYKMEGVGVNDNELRFNNLPSPISVSVGDEFQIWHGQDILLFRRQQQRSDMC